MIPKENKYQPARCYTVADLLAALSKLPPEMETKISFEDSVDVVVYNEGQHDEHVSFEEGGMWTDEESDDNDD